MMLAPSRRHPWCGPLDSGPRRPLAADAAAARAVLEGDAAHAAADGVHRCPVTLALAPSMVADARALALAGARMAPAGSLVADLTAGRAIADALARLTAGALEGDA